MLKELLREIGLAKAFSISLLAKNLNITEAMVEDMIEQLIRMGYLIEDLGSPSCATACGSCAFARSCNFNPVNFYQLSDKGKKLIA